MTSNKKLRTGLGIEPKRSDRTLRETGAGISEPFRPPRGERAGTMCRQNAVKMLHNDLSWSVELTARFPNVGYPDAPCMEYI